VSTRGSASGGWVPVVCGGTNGFVHGDYLTIGSSSAPAPKPSTPAPGGLANGDHAKVTDNLNLRYQASLGSGVAAVAPAGTVVLITGGASNGFYSVDWDGLRGFMSGDYLSKTSAALSQRGGSATAPAQPAPGGGGTATGNAMVDFAMGYVGYPYVWATHGPASFDCSGFTYWVTKNVLGRDIGTGTWTQVSAGQSVSRSNLQPGDLVFFQNTYTAGLSHVGLYIGGGQFIHAQNEATGVVISDLSSTYYASRWYGAVRLT
jgi:cell wall-associated NlpC family hydrolase